MRKAILFLTILLAFAACEWQQAVSKCCPPPPVTTGPGRTIPRSERTSIPTTDITLPPTTNISSTGLPSAPTGTNTGPITATTGQASQRTTGNFSGGFTSMMTVPGATTGGGGRSNSNSNGGTNNWTPGGSGGMQSTEAPTLLSNPFNLGSIPFVAEFEWEEWWDENIGYLLADYTASKEKDYASSLKPDDIPNMLVLLAYRGLFDEGIHKIAINGLKELGPGAIDVLASIASSDYKFGKDNARVSFMNKKDYEYLAVRALGYLGGKKAADAVAAVLNKDNGYTSPQAAASPADALLTKMVKDGDSVEKRFFACLALGQIGDPDYLPILSNALSTDNDKFVRAAAAEAIAMIGGSKSIPILSKAIDESKAYYHVKTFVAASLGFVGAADPIEDVAGALNSSDGNVRVSGAWALAYLINRRLLANKEHTTMLDQFVLSLKKEGDDEVRRSMALGFALMPSIEILEDIKPFLIDTRDAGVRSIAALAVGFIGSPSCVEMLATLPTDADNTVEASRGFALALLSSSNKKKLALDLMDSENAVQKAVGILQASKIMGQDLYRDVDDYRLYKGDEIVRRAVAFTMVVNHGEKGLSASRRLITGNSDAMKTIVFTSLGFLNDANALAELTKYTKLRDKEMKKSVDIGLALMGGLPLVQSMTEALKDGKEQVRSAAVIALGSLNRPESIDTIMNLVAKDQNYKVRGYALAALASVTIPDDQVERVVKFLAEIIKDKQQQPMVRCYAAFSLSMFPQSRTAFDAVQNALDSNQSDVQAMAAISLGMFKNPSAVRDIKALIAKKRGTPLADAGYIALGMVGDKSFVQDIISDFEFANNEGEFLAMAFAIAKCADKETYVSMLPYLENQDIFLKEFSIKCLGMMENLGEEARKEIISKLEKLETDKDPYNVFNSSVVRYNLGDKKALPVILAAVRDKGFTISDREGADWFTLMDMINSTMPPYRKVKTFIWKDEE